MNADPDPGRETNADPDLKCCNIPTVQYLTVLEGTIPVPYDSGTGTFSSYPIHKFWKLLTQNRVICCFYMKTNRSNCLKRRQNKIFGQTVRTYGTGTVPGTVLFFSLFGRLWAKIKTVGIRRWKRYRCLSCYTYIIQKLFSTTFATGPWKSLYYY